MRGIISVKSAQVAFIVAIVFTSGSAIWQLSAQQAAHREAARKHTHEYAAQAEQRIAEVCTNREARAYAKCIVEIVDATRESQRAEQDLSAQKEVADWTLWAVILSSIAILVSGAGLVALVRTVEQGREALAHAQKVSRADLRPWLTPVGFSVNPFTNGFIGDVPIPYGLRVSLDFLNTGKSPALNVGMWCASAVTALDAPPPRFERPPIQRTGGSVGPGRNLTGAPLGIYPADTDAIMSHRARLWLHAYIEYQDPTHEAQSYWTETTLGLASDGIEKLPDGTEKTRFRASSEGQNSMG
jgi:hypothetical protein